MFLFSSKSNDLHNDEGFPECLQQEGDAAFGVVWLLRDNELSPLDLDLTAGGGRPITEKNGDSKDTFRILFQHQL